ncbi:enoyl-CoA hydratase/isomerase family protein [Urechidicola sp. KH5]
MEQGSIDVVIKDRVARVAFYHPAGNSFPSSLLQSLTNHLNKLSQDNLVAVILLQSKGERAFCAGASFDELVAIENMQQGQNFFMGFANVINAMRTCKKPIIGRVQGKAVGGGVGLIAACDFVYATQYAAVKLSELAIGIGPFVIEPALERKIGRAAVSTMAFNPTEWYTAEWAETKGLFSKVFESTEIMDEQIYKHIAKLSSYNVQALEDLKATLWQGTGNWGALLSDRAAISGKLVLSEATKSALQQFKNKSK